MTEPIAYGIDFGTSNDSVAVAYAGRVEVVPVEVPSSFPESLPSIIHIGRTGNELAGNAAVERFLVAGGRRTYCAGCSLVTRVDGQALTGCRLYRAGGGCQDARIISGIKGDLHGQERRITHSWAHDFTLDGLASIILHRLKAEADRFCGAVVPRVVIGYPVAFAGTEGPEYAVRQARAEECLVDAGRAAGFTEVVLYPEPAAAAMGEPLEDGILLALDFGGGTFDAAVIRYQSGAAEAICLKGTAIGGQVLDEALFTAKVAPHLGLAQTYGGGPDNHLPNWLVDQLSSLSGVSQLLGERMAYPVLAEFVGRSGGERLRPVQELLYGGYAYAFYRAIEEAKIRLSTADETRIRFARARLNLDLAIRRDEYEALIKGYIEQVVAVVLDALEAVDLTPGDVDVVIRTGGSGQTPLFVRYLQEIFGAGKVQERNAFTSVARGLGLYAQARWTGS